MGDSLGTAWGRLVGVLGLGFLGGMLSMAAPGGAPPEKHWAFEPISRPPVPPGEHPVDAFVRATLKSRGLAPNPPASPRDWVRRIHFDLTGLPPEPGVVAEFERDPSQPRSLALIDRLLASPHYGERWARHWLDVVRYTESQGFEYDRPRDHAWPYRDYVIRSFKADLPYDRFMREQVAGDVLEPVTADGIVASSMLVSGPWDQAGNAQANATQRAITREEEMDDLVSVVSQTFLGLTVNCARCHDHKFDPIPIGDYYRVKAVFEGVRHGDRPIEGDTERRLREGRKERLRRTVEAETRAVAAIEARGAARVPRIAGQTPVAPQARFQWRFDRLESAEVPGEKHGPARVAGGVLELPQAGAWFQSRPLTQDIRDKTLSGWVRLSDLQQSGGAVISLEQSGGRVFDAIVFGERQPRKWAAGSDGFQRTRDLQATEETEAHGGWVHLAAVYSADRRVALYRNGQPYGAPYEVPSLVTFLAGDARVTIGRRHEGGGKPWLTGAVRQAALHDRALSSAEIQALFQHGGGGPSLAESVARLTPKELRDREAARQRLQEAQRALQSEDRPAAQAYAGRREQPAPTRILRRGDVKSPGDTVNPSGLSALAALPGDLGLSPDAPEAERRRRVDAFQKGAAKVFLVSLKAGGTGLNLTAADTVFLMDPWWNPAAEDQAADRAHRLGQDKAVTVVRLVARGTIEEKVLELHAKKRGLVEGVLGEADLAGKLSTDELVDLLKGGGKVEAVEPEAPESAPTPAKGRHLRLVEAAPPPSPSERTPPLATAPRAKKEQTPESSLFAARLLVAAEDHWRTRFTASTQHTYARTLERMLAGLADDSGAEGIRAALARHRQASERLSSGTRTVYRGIVKSAVDGWIAAGLASEADRERLVEAWPA